MLDGIFYTLRDNCTGEVVAIGWDPLQLAPLGETPGTEDYNSELADQFNKGVVETLKTAF